jgi:hypothetical protein
MAAKIPDHELQALIRTANDAVLLATQGRLADGYTRLLAGLHRARVAGEAEQPWAPELIQRYRRAMDRYVQRYGVRMR